MGEIIIGPAFIPGDLHGITVAVVAGPDADGQPDLLEIVGAVIFWALRLAAASAGKSMAARMAMMAMTTSSSMSVNAVFCFRSFFIR